MLQTHPDLALVCIRTDMPVLLSISLEGRPSAFHPGLHYVMALL